EMAVLGGNALRMEFHAVHRQMRVGESHDQPVIGFGDHVQLGGPAGAIDHERMVARRLERTTNAAEHAAAAMLDGGKLAVDRHRRAYDLATEGLSDRLMAET